MSRRTALLLVLLAALLVQSAASAYAAGWHSEQPLPPPPAEGQTGVGVPVALGHVGDIEFWAPNRGLLITAGNEAIPAGLYYYDGVSWHELSIVCGGADGRIAWAGPDDFWTISDQQTGQQIGAGTALEADRDISLCHFENGKFVASYAEPIGTASSYQHMDAAACAGPNDCWFAGERLPPGGNSGAFHLHWNGESLTAAPSLTTPEPQLQDPARKVADIAVYNGHFYESVQVQQDDPNSSSESASEPYLLHRIVEGSSSPFTPEIPEGLFTYGVAGVKPWELSAFALSAGSNGLWAIAGPDGGSTATPARVTMMMLRPHSFEQVPLTDPSGAFPVGDQIAGVAAEPGMNDAWVAVDPPSGEAASSSAARVARVHADGEVEPAVELPEAGEALSRKGEAGPVACPAQGDCWLATSRGWLFHLGGSEPQDTDPNFQKLITYRPRDASLPFVPPDEPPPDDSGDNPGTIPPPVTTAPATAPPALAHEALFSNVKERLVKGTTLAITFTLTTKSHVRLLALHGKRSVASTKRVTLARGRHTLKLALSRKAWPTKLDLQVQAIGAVPLVPSGAGSGPTGGPTSVETSFHAFRGTPLTTGPFASLP